MSKPTTLLVYHHCVGFINTIPYTCFLHIIFGRPFIRHVLFDAQTNLGFRRQEGRDVFGLTRVPARPRADVDRPAAGHTGASPPNRATFGAIQ